VEEYSHDKSQNHAKSPSVARKMTYVFLWFLLVMIIPFVTVFLIGFIFIRHKDIIEILCNTTFFYVLFILPLNIYLVYQGMKYIAFSTKQKLTINHVFNFVFSRPVPGSRYLGTGNDWVILYGDDD
jgi:hypothetical protein